MKVVFIEAKTFSKKADKLLNPEELRLLQNELLENPKKGDVVPEGSGLRKLRLALSKGKRSGARIYYLYATEQNKLYIYAIFSKNEKVDLSKADLKAIRLLAQLDKKG